MDIHTNDFDEAGGSVVPNVLSPRDQVSRLDNLDETVLHTNWPFRPLRLAGNFVIRI